MRTAKVIDQYKIGDHVKILKKKYSDNYESYHGILVGFDDFKSKPTLIVAYLDYNELKFEYINDDCKTEVCIANEHDTFIDGNNILERMQNDYLKKIAEAEEMQRKLTYFREKFGHLIGGKKSE
ncbi:hypothetical protein [Flavobacterium alkalisoli]|uniref:hypothetical protein n=1 Tax=Flavobacterium alkalisoli TaxID=2602769 RepID=UPI003A8F5AB7